MFKSSTHAPVSLKTRIGVGAAALLSAAAMIGAGVSAASASTPTPSPSATAGATASAKAKGQQANPLSMLLTINDNSPQAAGDRAAKLATALANHPQVFAKLPAALQADVTTLKNAAPADRVKDAVKIKTTALSGGYGAEIQKRAENLQKTAVQAAGLRQELRTALQSTNPGAAAQVIADQLIGHKNLFAKLPANLQTDLTALKNAGPADVDAQANKIKSTALAGGYGTQVQKAIQTLEGKAAAKS